MSSYPSRLARIIRYWKKEPRRWWDEHPEITFLYSWTALTALFFVPIKMKYDLGRALYSTNYLVYRQDDPAVLKLRPHTDYPQRWYSVREEYAWWSQNRDYED